MTESLFRKALKSAFAGAMSALSDATTSPQDVLDAVEDGVGLMPQVVSSITAGSHTTTIPAGARTMRCILIGGGGGGGSGGYDSSDSGGGGAGGGARVEQTFEDRKSVV